MADAAYDYNYSRDHITYADYKSWDLKEGERYEVIYGVAYAMSAPTYRHQRIVMALGGELYAFLKGKPCHVLPSPFDVRLFYEEDESDDTIVQPDLVVICDKRKRGPEGCRGAPELVVEVLSPSNSASEMGRKFKLYGEAGVREYWVIDGEYNMVTVHLLAETPIVSRVYRETEIVTSTVLQGLEIPLPPVFAE